MQHHNGECVCTSSAVSCVAAMLILAAAARSPRTNHQTSHSRKPLRTQLPTAQAAGCCSTSGGRSMGKVAQVAAFLNREVFLPSPSPFGPGSPARRGAHGVVVSCCRPKTKGASRGRARRRCAVGAMAPLAAEARLRGQKSRCWRRTPAHRRPRTGFPSFRARRRPPACTNVRSRGSRCRPQQRTPWRI